MSSIELNDISVRFRKHQGFSHGLKEAVLRKLVPPAWYKATPPSKTDFWGLKNVTLDLREGDRLGVIGHNGAGKSTLLKVISRIYRPTLGKLHVNGRLAPLIEIGAGFSGELTGRENAFLNAAILGIPRKQIARCMDDIVEFSELQDFIDMPVKYYSTGMHLRLAFAVATQIPPDILILDELYAGGDAAFVAKANVRLDAFVAQSKILILVAHNMDYIRRFCTRVILLEHGKLVAHGTPDEVIARYKAMGQELPV